jgi:hypothetical protein
MSAGKAGYCYGAMGSRMLEFALERHPHRQMAENASPKVDAPLHDAKVSCTD